MYSALVVAAIILAIIAGTSWALIALDAFRSPPRQPGRYPPPDRLVGTTAGAKRERWEIPGVKWSIYERDSWRCHLCGGEVWQGMTDPTKVAQIDHIVPRSSGGGHEDSNLATSCRRCNLLKGNYEDNDAVRRAVAAWRSWNDPATPWPETMKQDLTLYQELATRPGFSREMKKAGWSDGLSLVGKR